MIETIIPICQNEKLLELANDEDALCDFLIPFISAHRRDYTTILALGDIATIEFEPESVWLRSPYDSIDNLGVTGIKRFTRGKIQGVAWRLAHTLCLGLHEVPYRPDIEKAFDYDC